MFKLNNSNTNVYTSKALLINGIENSTSLSG